VRVLVATATTGVEVGVNVVVAVGNMDASKVEVNAWLMKALAAWAVAVWFAAAAASVPLPGRPPNKTSPATQAAEMRMIPPRIPATMINVRLFDSSGGGAESKSSKLVSAMEHSPRYGSLL